jgi:hypothetical protein
MGTEDFGMLISGLRHLEQDDNKPSWETVLSLADALGISVKAFDQGPAKRPPAGLATESRHAGARSKATNGASRARSRTNSENTTGNGTPSAFAYFSTDWRSAAAGAVRTFFLSRHGMKESVMKETMRAVAIGVFTDHTQADRAVAALKKSGFRDSQIGIVGKDWRTGGTVKNAKGETEAEEGALTGAIAGAGLGGLVGLGVLAGVIPVIGPAIAAGTLGIILTNAAAGAAIAGLVGALVGMGIPEDEAKYYEGEVKAGRYIVTVKDDARCGEAWDILRQNGAVARATAAKM